MDCRRGQSQHRLNKQAIVFVSAAGIARLAETKRLHLRPLSVSQNESVHPELESQSSSDENPKSKQALANHVELFFVEELLS